jgi:transposase-like protein
MRKRRRLTAEFKARVALEALRGDKMIQEIASKHQIQPNQVSAWKRRAVEGMSDVFAAGDDPRAAQQQTPAVVLESILDVAHAQAAGQNLDR